MSLTKLNTISQGLITGSDKLSLPVSLHVENNQLVDEATGASHTLDPLATFAVERLANGIVAGSWFEQLIDKGIQPAQIMEIITFLNHIGGLTIKRQALTRATMALQHISYRLAGIRVPVVAQRWPLGLGGLADAIFRAMAPLIALSSLLAIALYGAGLPALSSLGLTCLSLAIIWVSTLAHELTHARFVKNQQVHAVILQRGLRLGILHKPTSPSTEILSALGGPLVGASVALMISTLIYRLGLPGFMTLGWLVALFHLFSLLPAYGDGQTVLKQLRRRKIVQNGF